MSWFSKWNKRRKQDKWLINEFPKIALAQFETLQDLNPSDTPKEEMYQTIVKGFAFTTGMPNDIIDEFSQHILQTARNAAPLSLRMVVSTLICLTCNLRTEIAVGIVMSSVASVIPENL